MSPYRRWITLRDASSRCSRTGATKGKRPGNVPLVSSPPRNDISEIAARVRGARAYAGLTREQLAARVPLSSKQLKDLETGRRQVTTREELYAVAAACGVPPEFLTFGFTGAADLRREIRELAAAIIAGKEAVLRAAAAYGIEDAPNAAGSRPASAGRGRRSGRRR